MPKMIPEILYKYRFMTPKTLDMLANNQVYFAHPSEFNDPFDCSAQENMHDHFRNDMARVTASRDLKIELMLLTNDQIQQYRDLVDQELEGDADALDAMEELKDRLGILSFSKRNDSILMWSHYADMHRGFCVGFSTKNFGAAIEEFRAVLYPKERNVNFAFNLISNPKMTEEKFEEEFWREYALTKYVDWQYEQEWRLIGQARTISTYPDEAIDRVIFGLKMLQKDRDQIRSVLRGKNISFFEAVKANDVFALQIKQVND